MNTDQLRRIWFLGDVHGEFRHIEQALLMSFEKPDWLVFLGDIDDKPFREILAPLHRNFPAVRVPQVDLWLHGHIHTSVDYQVGRCRVVTNPAGYLMNHGWATSRADFQFENQLFNPNLLIVV